MYFGSYNHSVGNILGKLFIFSENFMDKLKDIVKLILEDWRDYYSSANKLTRIFSVVVT